LALYKINDSHLTLAFRACQGTRYVRKGLVPKVKKMTERHKKVRTLIQKLSKVNWELLELESKE